MSQSWIEITLEVDKAEAEDWADALLEAGALSVQAEDADADSPDEQPLFGEPVPPGLPGTGAGYLPQTFGWKRTRLAVLLDATEDDSAAGQTPAPANLAVLQEAADSLEKPLPDIVGTRRVDDQDWVRLTQAQFDPIPVGQRLLILPSWHAAETQAGDREALIIDPGLAFGTGSHPTTRLCLEWLDEHDLSGLRVIDLQGHEWTDASRGDDQKTFHAVAGSFAEHTPQDPSLQKADRLHRVAVLIRNQNGQNQQPFDELKATCDESFEIVIEGSGDHFYPSNEGARLATEIANELRKRGAGRELHIAWSAAVSLAPLVARRTNTLNCVLYELTQNQLVAKQRYQKVLRVAAGMPHGPIIEVFDKVTPTQ